MDDSQSWDKLVAFLQDEGLAKQGMYICWLIWNNRNNCLQNMTWTNPTSLVIMAAKMEREHNAAVNLPSSADQVIRDEWLPPPRVCYKINMDGNLLFYIKGRQFRRSSNQKI